LKPAIKQVGNERRACYLITQKSILFGPGEDATIKIEYRANVSQVKAKGGWFAGWLYANGFSGGNATDSIPGNGMEIDVFE